MKPKPRRFLLERYVRRLAHERGWTLVDLAQHAGVGRETIYRMFNQRSPRFDTLLKLADALDTTPGALLDGSVIGTGDELSENLKMLFTACKDLKQDAQLRVLWYARYERDVNAI